MAAERIVGLTMSDPSAPKLPSAPRHPKPSPRFLTQKKKSTSKGEVPSPETAGASPKGVDKREHSTPKGEGEAASTIQKRFRRRSTAAEEKKAEASSSQDAAPAPKKVSMFPRFGRKSTANSAEEKATEEEAAVTIQSRFRGNQQRMPKKLRQAGEALDESLINFKTAIAQKAAAKGVSLVRAPRSPRATRVCAHACTWLDASAGHQDGARGRPVDPKEHRESDRGADDRAD